MRSSHSLDGVAVIFDDDHAVANAGLILTATLSQHLGLRQLFDDHVDLGDAPGHAKLGAKAMTLDKRPGSGHGVCQTSDHSPDPGRSS